MISLFWAVCLLLFMTKDVTAEEKESHGIESPVKTLNRYEEVCYNDYNDGSFTLLSRDKMIFLQEAIELIENEECRSQCQYVLNGIRNLSKWAVEFYDASGKFPNGVLAGSIYQLGNFDECLDIDTYEETPANIRGRYCLSEITVNVSEGYSKRHGSVWEIFEPTGDILNEPISEVYWGICVPAACTPQDVENAVGRVIVAAFGDSQLKFTARLPKGSCSDRSSISIETEGIAYICIIVVMIVMVGTGTIFHVLHLRNKVTAKGVLPRILIACSVVSNLKSLAQSPRHKDLHVDFISGIKLMSMLIIIASHSSMLFGAGPLLRVKYYSEKLLQIHNSLLTNAPLFADTFLLISAFLLCRILLQELDKKKSINVLKLYVTRYIRLTPAYFAVIGFYVTWLTKVDSGPLSYRIVEEQERCLSSWWLNLLYVNNYIDTNNICMFQSWNLAVDTQLYIISPVIIYSLWKWPTIGKYLLFVSTTLSIVVLFVFTFVKKFDPVLLVYRSTLQELTTSYYFVSSYVKTHMRAIPWCFGLACGYVLYRIQTSNYKFPKNMVRCGWLLATLLLIASTFSTVIFYGPRMHFTVIESSVFAVLQKVFWSLGTCWFILACATDNSGLIKNVLEWQPLSVLSKLTYCAYLINGFIVYHNFVRVRAPRSADYSSMMNMVLSDIVTTFFGGFLLSMIFEFPITEIQRILL